VTDAPAFALVCSHLETTTGLDRPAARGTVRLALKEAGLDAETVSPAQMSVVVQKLLPRELRSLRISDVEGHCTALLARLKRLAMGDATGGDGPQAVFQRLGR
jgi:hypothetical protein